MDIVSYTVPYARAYAYYQDLYFYDMYMGSVATSRFQDEWYDPQWLPESKIASKLKDINLDGKPGELEFNDASKMIHFYSGALWRYVCGDGVSSNIKVIKKIPEQTGKVWSSKIYKKDNNEYMEFKYPDYQGLTICTLHKGKFGINTTSGSTPLQRLFNQKFFTVQRETAFQDWNECWAIAADKVEQVFESLVESDIFM